MQINVIGNLQHDVNSTANKKQYKLYKKSGFVWRVKYLSLHTEHEFHVNNRSTYSQFIGDIMYCAVTAWNND